MPSENGTAGIWTWLDPVIASAIDHAVAGLAPHPVKRPTAVKVGDKLVRGPETYFRLLAGRADGLITPVTIWITVTMRSDLEEPSPDMRG